MTKIAVLAAALASPLLFAQANSAPSLPRIDKNACPFECCQFGQWTANKSVPVFSDWQKGRHKLLTISKGEKVTAVTGIHITYEPGHLRALTNMADINVKPGDTILTYMYRGEGDIDSWANGRWLGDQQLDSVVPCSQTTKPHEPACMLDRGKKEWWVLIKTSSGKQGWIQGNHGFDGSDGCA